MRLGGCPRTNTITFPHAIFIFFSQPLKPSSIFKAEIFRFELPTFSSIFLNLFHSILICFIYSIIFFYFSLTLIVYFQKIQETPNPLFLKFKFKPKLSWSSLAHRIASKQLDLCFHIHREHSYHLVSDWDDPWVKIWFFGWKSRKKNEKKEKIPKIQTSEFWAENFQIRSTLLEKSPHKIS